MKRSWGIAAVTTLLVAGCGTASTSRNSWLYSGTDPTLERPPSQISPALRREIAAERRDDPYAVLSADLQARLIEDFRPTGSDPPRGRSPRAPPPGPRSGSIGAIALGDEVFGHVSGRWGTTRWDGR